MGGMEGARDGRGKGWEGWKGQGMGGMEGAREGAWDSPYGFGLLPFCAGSTVAGLRCADTALEGEGRGAGHCAAGSHGLLFSHSLARNSLHSLNPRHEIRCPSQFQSQCPSSYRLQKNSTYTSFRVSTAGKLLSNSSIISFPPPPPPS